MSYIVSTTLFAILSTSAALCACSKEEQGAGAAPRSQPNVEQATYQFAQGMMDSYESCRSLLAGDSSDGIVECATGIVAASKTAHASAPNAAHKHIEALVTTAEALAKSPMDDIEKVRLAFGEVSKSVIAMLTASPELGKQYHVFECPMAKGYRRWAQATAKLENPYMGTAMLTCGSEVHDHHEGVKLRATKTSALAPAHGNHTH